MPDNKLTDSEIVKALEHIEAFTCCENCAFYKKCKGKCVITATLDLINRLQAENERLEKKNKNLLSKLCQKVRTVSKAVEKHIKAEAYKEFANELKCRTHEISCNTAQVVTRCDIDNLLKELVGEDNES